MRGGFNVVGCVTGTHIIADIGVVVPHRVAVHIPADLVLRSKDIHKSLQQGAIMKLAGGSALRPEREQSYSQTHADLVAKIARLEAENKKLRQEKAALEAREAGLHQLLSSLGGQLSGIQGALGRLEANGGQPLVQYVQASAGGGTAVASPQIEAVGGEAPAFIPDQIAPEGAEASITIKTEESSQSNVSDARSRLRELRKSQAGGD